MSRRVLQLILTLLVVGAFAVSRVYLLFYHLHKVTDLLQYLEWLRLAARHVPFVDFPIEYPPLAWWVMELPATTDRISYLFRFRLLMGAADLGAFALLWWIALKRRPTAAPLVAAVYVVTTTVLEYVLYDRLDALVLFLLLSALGAWLQAEYSPHGGAWRTLAYVAVGLGASFKLIPGVMLPFLLIGDLRTERRWRPIMGRLGVCLAVAAAPFAISYPTAGLATLGFLRYHAARGLEIESTWAALMWLFSRGDRLLRVTARFGSWELAGSREGLFVGAASVSSIVTLGGLVAWALLLKARFTARRAYVQALLTVLGMIVVSKVFSEQYLIWVLPLMMLAAIELTEDVRGLAVVAAAAMTIAVLSVAVYPIGKVYIAHLNVWIMLALTVRNLLYASVVAGLYGLAWSRDRQATGWPPSGHPRPSG